MSEQIQEPLLEVTHLTKCFPVKRSLQEAFSGHKQNIIRALDDVTFSIYKGETLGLVGESGCGKSTLSKTLMRLYKPEQGCILLDGKIDMTTLNKKDLRNVRKRMQMVFQDPYSSLNPKMTVRQCFYEVLSVHNICPRQDFEEKSAEILTMVGMPPDTLNRYPQAFSGGQLQRIGIARALLLQPDLLIADEPVSALDMSVQAQIINLLAELKETLQLTILFISHDLRMIQYLSDRVIVMHEGRIVEIGETQDLFTHPEHSYTRSLLDSLSPDKK